ncbi:MAG: STT3 domain-containing protein [Candidatus Nanoarchaeia archaeon]|nr:STT3 domain-containing protein [Candidatus Nanoarchaeia archaeon]
MADDDIEIDFSKIKNIFKQKKQDDEIIKSDEKRGEIKLEHKEEKIEEPKKEKPDFETKSIQIVHNKDDESIDINLDGVKKFFSKIKDSLSDEKTQNGLKEKNADDDFDFDIKKIKPFVKKNQKWVCVGVLFAILLSAYIIRTAGAPNLRDSMLIELDSYLFYRYAGYILEGNLPDIDIMRYYPTGTDTHYESLMPSYAILSVYYIANFFNPDFTLMQAAIYYPAIYSTLALIFFFLLAKELFKSKWTALISTAFLAFCPAIMFRSSVGFADKESVAILLIFAAFYFYIKAEHSKNKKALLFASLSGIATGLAGLSWGGFVSVPVVIGLYNFILILFSKMDKKRLFNMLFWLIFMTPLLIFGTFRHGGTEVFAREWYAIPLFSFICSIIYVLKPFKKIKIIKSSKITPEVSAVIIGVLLTIVAVSVVFGIDYIPRTLSGIYNRIINPLGTGVFTQSVSENQQPVFYDPYSGVDWWSNLQYFMITSLAGTVMLFLFALEKIKKYKWLLTIAFAVFIVFFIFSNFSTAPEYSHFNEIFGRNYWWSLFVFLGLLILFYLTKWKKISDEAKSAVKGEYILLVLWVVLQIIAARGAVRLIYAFAPPAMLASGFFITKTSELITKATKDKLYVGVMVVITALIIYWAFTTSYSMTLYMGPSMTLQWEDAMGWVRENTDETSVFAHWWDYGYYVQSVGERATNLDGGNYMVERNELIARHVFAAYNNSEALEALEFFGNPDYFLIVDDDIPKYYQISRIGERPAWFRSLTYQETIRNAFEDKEEFPYLVVYNPVYATDVQEDMTFGEVFLKGSETYIVRVAMPVDENMTKIGAPYVYVYNSRLRTSLGQFALMRADVLCEYGVGCSGDVNSSEFPGAFMFIGISGIPDETGKEGLIYIPKRGMEHLFTKLYVLNLPNPLFEEVYNSGYPLTLQGIHSSRDPTNIRIYKINYNITE